MQRSPSRRAFVRGMGAAGLALAAGCVLWQAKPAPPPARVPRIGVLAGDPAGAGHVAFREGLRDFGYIDGQNLAIEYRFAEGLAERYPELAAELVAIPVDVIVAAGVADMAAKRATTSIPVVMANASDPVGMGLVESLARPGGNVTGVTLISPQLSGKRAEKLREILPGASNVAIVRVGPVSAPLDPSVQETQAALEGLGIQTRFVEVPGLEVLDSAFASMASERLDALVLNTTPFSFRYRARLAEVAVASQLPLITDRRDYVDAGSLMTYAANNSTLWRRAAYYVDRILKGTKPADLPVEQPREFDFVINLKTAHALGLTIPPSVLLQATEVIQ